MTAPPTTTTKFGYIGHWLPSASARGLLGRRHAERGTKTELPCGLVVEDVPKPELGVHALLTDRTDPGITCEGCLAWLAANP